MPHAREKAAAPLTASLQGRTVARGLSAFGESFRAVLLLLRESEAIRLSISRRSDPTRLAIRVTLALNDGGSRKTLACRALAAALEAAFPHAVFQIGEDADPRHRSEGSQPINPRSLHAAQWLERTTAAPAPRLATGSQEPTAPARPEAGSRLDLSSTGLDMLFAVIDCALSLELAISPVTLSAPELRRLRQIEQKLCEAIRQPDDPLVDRASIRELTRARALIAEPTAWRLSCQAHAERPLSEDERDLISNTVFGAPALAEGETPDAADLSMLLPNCVGAAAIEYMLAVGIATAFRIEERALPRPESGTHLGNTLRGEPVVQAREDRAQHCYCVGATGTGKSTLLRNIVLDDIEAGEGVVLMDVQGDLIAGVLANIPPGRRGDVFVADAGDPDCSFTFNVLQGNAGDPTFDRNLVINDIVELFRRNLYRGVQEAFGPMFEIYFRNAALLLMASMGDRATILDFEKVFQSTSFRHELLERCPLEYVKDFWLETAERVTNHEISLESIAPYIICKLNQITTNERMRPILGAVTSSLDFAEIIAKRGIALINLNKRMLGSRSADFLGGLMLSRLNMAALAQLRLPDQQRTPCSIVLDEFQNYATDSLSMMLAETRKCGFRIALANQSISQIDGRGLTPNVLGPLLANIGSLISFRVGAEDAKAVAGWFEPAITQDFIMQLPNYTAVTRLLHKGEPLRPIVMRTLSPRVRSEQEDSAG